MPFGHQSPASQKENQFCNNCNDNRNKDRRKHIGAKTQDNPKGISSVATVVAHGGSTQPKRIALPRTYTTTTATERVQQHDPKAIQLGPNGLSIFLPVPSLKMIQLSILFLKAF